MSEPLSDRVAVITGASAGIGAALAREWVEGGGKVVLVARRREKLEAVAAPFVASAQLVVADVTRRPQVEGIVPQVLERWGRLDVWVNNAGRGITRSVAELSVDDLEEMMRDNVTSALFGMQAVLPHFKRTGEGVLVNVSSMLSRVASVNTRSAYTASKAALNALTESLRVELVGGFPGIHVALAFPGIVATDFGNNALGGGPDSRSLPGAQSAAEVARAIVRGVQERRPEIYTRPESLDQTLSHLQSLAQRRTAGALTSDARRSAEEA